MPDEERFPTCARDDVVVGVSGGGTDWLAIARSRGVDDTGEGVFAYQSKVDADGDGGRRWSGRINF